MEFYANMLIEMTSIQWIGSRSTEEVDDKLEPAMLYKIGENLG